LEYSADNRPVKHEPKLVIVLLVILTIAAHLYLKLDNIIMSKNTNKKHLNKLMTTQ